MNITPDQGSRTHREWDDIFQAIGHPVIILDPSHTIIEANNAAIKLTGLSGKELIGKRCYEIFHSKDSEMPPSRCPMEHMLNSRHLETTEIEMEALSCTYLVSCTPVFDRQGNLEKIIHIATDITERKRTEAALKESEKILQTIIETEPECVKLLDADGNLLQMNRAGLAMIQADSMEEVKGQSVCGLVAPEYRAAFDALRERAFSGESGILEFEAIGLQGRHIWLETHAVPLRNDKEEIIAMLGVTRDITWHKKAEQELRESRKQYHNLVEETPDLITRVDTKGRFVFANHAALEIFGLPPEDCIGRIAFDFIHPEDREMTMAAFQEWLKGSENIFTLENRQVGIDGREHNMAWSIRAEYDGNGNIIGFASTARDITEQMKLELQLRQAQKMEAIGQLAGGVAHDFNNILTAIMGYGSLALMNMAKDDPQRINIERMLEGSERASHLTNDLLLFSRKQISERKYVDLNEVIKKMEKFLIRIIGEDISCKTILNPGAILVLADAHQLEQVMMNLATNARDAMPRGGVFSVATEQIRLDKEFITAHGYGQPGTYALMTVSDTGKGMNETVRQRIFEPFFTTKVMGKGTGLGMAVVYGIVKGHYGYINVYSEPELGTTFKIYLPLTTMESEATQELIQPFALGKGETILVAEDDPAVREVFRISLEEHGYTVIGVENGEDAVKQYKDNMEKVSLVLLDVIMPVKNGMEAYEEIKSLNPDTKAIFMSGYTDDIIIGKGLLEADTELIAKPITPDRLLRKVREILDR